MSDWSIFYLCCRFGENANDMCPDRGYKGGCEEGATFICSFMGEESVGEGNGDGGYCASQKDRVIHVSKEGIFIVNLWKEGVEHGATRSLKLRKAGGLP